jgi:hypothetical protein
MGTVTVGMYIAFTIAILFIFAWLYYNSRAQKSKVYNDVESTLKKQGVDVSTLDKATIDTMVSNLSKNKGSDPNANVELQVGGTTQQSVVNAEMHLEAKYASQRATSSQGFFRGSSLRVIGLTTGLILIGGVVVLALFYPEWLYYGYLIGAAFLILLAIMINPSSMGKVVYGVILTILLAGAFVLFYLGISEVLIAAQLGGYTDEGGNERLS